MSRTRHTPYNGRPAPGVFRRKESEVGYGGGYRGSEERRISGIQVRTSTAPGKPERV